MLMLTFTLSIVIHRHQPKAATEAHGMYMSHGPARVTRGRLLGFKWGSNSTLVNVVLNSCRENSPMPPMQNTKQALPMFVTGKVPRESKMGLYTILTIYDVYLRIYLSSYDTCYHGARKGAYD